jgi:hypothetical protein
MMNRRGELEKAASEARMPLAAYALFTQMARRVGHGTGEIPADRYAPRLDTLIRQAKLTRSPGYRALAWLTGHGWFDRYPAPRGKIAGKLKIGRYDRRDRPGEPVRTCEVCGVELPSSTRTDARYCSYQHRQAAWRSSRRAVTKIPQSRNENPAEASFSVPLSRNKPTSMPVETRVERKESSKENRVKRTGRVDLVPYDGSEGTFENPVLPDDWADRWEMERAVQLVLRELGGQVIATEDRQAS